MKAGSVLMVGLLCSALFAVTGCSQLLSLLGALPDFSVSSVSFTSGTTAGLKAVLSSSSINQESVDYAIVLNSSANFSKVDTATYPVVFRGTATIPAQGSVTVTENANDLNGYVQSNGVPLADGIYYVDVYVNPEKKISESDRTNDIAASTETVRVSTGSVNFPSNTAPPPAPVAPAPPMGVSAAPPSTTDGSTLLVSWPAVSNATSYTVYEDTSSTGSFTTQAAAGTTASSVTVGSLVSGTTYWFEVVAVNSAGTSPPSSPVSGTTEGPPPPTGLSVSCVNPGGTTDTCTVTWSPVTSATSYHVWRATSSDPSTAITLATVYSGTSYADNTAAHLAFYHYWVDVTVSGYSATSTKGGPYAVSTK